MFVNHSLGFALLIAGVSAHYYSDYGYQSYYPGIKKGVNFHDYKPGVYYKGGHGGGYGSGYGGGEYGGYGSGGYGGYGGYGSDGYSSHVSKHRPYYIKQLPPIYKDVKVPVVVHQPVIVRKIPVITKTKEVTIKKEPPIVITDTKKTNVIDKDIGVGVGGMSPIGGAPDFGIDYAMKEKIPPQVMPSVEYDIKKEIEKGMEGKDGMDGIDIDDKMMTDVKDMMDGKVESAKDKMMMKVDIDDGFGDFDTKDFEVGRFKINRN